MESALPASESACAVFIDLGTTNTRAWLVRGEAVLARGHAPAGVRDSARDGNSSHLRQTLRTLLASLADNAGERPQCVIAAGMITSALGLAEVPHVSAPAGAAELAAATRRYAFADVTPLPVFLVPGVRSGNSSDSPKNVCAGDLMRGEETLSAGLVALGLATAPGVVLNLGSHWKAVRLDALGRVAGSVTSLAGEMIHAIATTTILASALPAERPGSLDVRWLGEGMAEQRRSGLARALFCVRLLEQSKACTPQERFAFLVGAFIASDMDALFPPDSALRGAPVAIVGHPSIAGAWRLALERASIPAGIITEQQAEAALLGALRRILDLAYAA